MRKLRLFSVSTIFCLELIDFRAVCKKGMYSFLLWSREKRERRMRGGEENMAQTLESREKLLTLNLSRRRLYKLQARIRRHDDELLSAFPDWLMI